MKITSDKWQMTSDKTKAAARGEPSCHLSPVTFHRQNGVALVLTLILLSVALVMAVAFLAISGHERGSVTTQTDTTTTRLAADSGLAAAEAQIAANVLATTNPYNYGLLVSTNYAPYQPPFANVAQVLQILTNLQYSPRAPVAIQTNAATPLDFRFYLDLNRNGQPDANGWVYDPATGTTNFEVGDPEWIGVLARPDLPYGPNNPFVARYAFIALPAGNALDLNYIHNQALSPAARQKGTIAVNPPPLPGDWFFRNQGAGSWEINSAAFLADLNTNEWNNNISGNGYAYNQANPLPFANSGAAFDDARALVAFRYATNYHSLAPVGGVIPTFLPPLFTTANSFPPFQGNIDAYSDGPLQTTPAGINESVQPVASPWVGADNTNRFFDVTADVFDPTKTALGVTAFNINSGNYFTGRLLAAGAATGSAYDRYTFYRMLAQIGTDSSPESGLMNLNYDNLDPGSNGVLVAVGGIPSATNFVPWTPQGFFVNAADRLLKAYTAQWATGHTNINGVTVATSDANFVATFNVTVPFGVTNIPVWVSNRFVYTPAVNRLLQLAANMYDATTPNHYPDIFRPLFTVTNGNVFITGYTNVTSFGGVSDSQFNLPIEISDLAATNILNVPVNVYGVPWIVGAKKGFPNFNELAMDCAFQVTRKVEVTRPSTNALANTYSYYQMFILNITNQVGVECWNSYTNAYTNGVMIYVYDNLRNVVLTNDEGYSTNFSIPLASADPVAIWPGTQTSYSFQIPLNTAVMTLTNSIYRFNQSGAPYLTPDLGQSYETAVIGYPQPHWWLTVTNDLRVIMVDTTVVSNRVIDYVELGGPNSGRDLTAEIIKDYDVNPDGSAGTDGNKLWATNFQNGVPAGLTSQIGVSLGLYSPDPANGGPWPASTPADIAQEQDDEVDGFRAFFHIGPKYNNIGSQQAIAAAMMTNAMQAPFTPTATVVQHVSWQANDPLVHYLATDLNWASAIKYDRNVTALWDSSDGDNLGLVNTRYAPWGKLLLAGTDQVDQNPNNLAYKDPLVASSDNWDFPNGKLPTIGWLGRVHRGTPWQTIYLKSTNILAWVQNNIGSTTWRDWTGNTSHFDANNAAPMDDRLLFDLFTTAFNDNATRGQLSVNQSAGGYDPVANPAAGLAAWSALFSGMVVITNYINNPPTNYTIINPAGPAGLNSALGQLVAGIDRTRAAFTNADGLVGAFEHKGDLLAVPALTDHSPFLTGLDPNTQVSDEMYEWLPQQMMSLVRDGASPRYVIYSFGQALKPAKDGTYLGAGPFLGMVTNYQVVAETATRAVLRFDTVRTNIMSGTNNIIIVSPPRAVIEQFNILPPN